jgi:hypothetical protein
VKKNKSSSSTLIRSMYRRYPSVLSVVASELFLGLGTAFSQECNSLFISGRHSELLERSVNPESYSNSSDFRDDYLAAEVLSKYPYLGINVDREAVALETFRKAEIQCDETNFRLCRKYECGITSLYTPESIISLARLKILSLLGPFSWDLASPHFGFGPGSTTSLRRSKGDAYFKYGAKRPQVTKACSVLGLLAIKQVPRWFSHLAEVNGQDPDTLNGCSLDEQVERLLDIVPGNRVTTVPKNAKTDRVIAIEPDLNMYVQKGIGSVIRNRLRRVGVDLNNQHQNQVLAREGSLTGTLATIDLKSASDTVSMRLVEMLLPDDWYSALKQCRSPRGTLPSGELITYHKVSSMGNGFTFELESLIFWAICKSVIDIFRPDENRLSVYGDDIILSSSIYGTVSWILGFCGFTVNSKKSFANGPFRESCGKHFFNGDDVTPFYIRDDIKTCDRIFWFANSLRRWVRLPTYGLDGRLERCYRLAVDKLPACLRQPKIPDGFGDIALIGDFDEARPQRSKHYQSWVAVGLSDVRDSSCQHDMPYLLRQLSSMERRPEVKPLAVILQEKGDPDKGMSGASFGLTSPSLKRMWSIVKIPITRWESYGEWLMP